MRPEQLLDDIRIECAVDTVGTVPFCHEINERVDSLNIKRESLFEQLHALVQRFAIGPERPGISQLIPFAVVQVGQEQRKFFAQLHYTDDSTAGKQPGATINFYGQPRHEHPDSMRSTCVDGRRVSTKFVTSESLPPPLSPVVNANTDSNLHTFEANLDAISQTVAWISGLYAPGGVAGGSPATESVSQ